MKDIVFDFFKVTTNPDCPSTLETVLEDSIYQKPFDKEGISCCVQEKKEKYGITAYLFTKIRMDELPQKAKSTGERAPLELEDDEGLGEDVAIAYYPPYKILAIQRNRYAFSANALVGIINNVNPMLYLNICPILTADAIERFYNCGIISKVKIKLAGTDDVSFLEETNVSTNTKLGIIEFLNEPSFEVTLSVGRKKQSLSSNVKNLLSSLLDAHKAKKTDSVKCLQITGKENDFSEKTTIDLLEDKLIHTAKVDIINRSLNTNTLLEQCCNSIVENKIELEKYRENS